jgi:hypothetical protein
MQLEFTVTEIGLFSSWLKRFSSIDKSLLLEIDLNSLEFLAKTYNEERSVVKYSKISFNDINFKLKTTKFSPDRIQMGLYDVSKIIKTFGQFKDEFTFIIKYDKIDDNENTKLVGKQLLLKNSTLKVGFDCTSLNIFKYITDNTFTDVICKIDSLLSFDLKQDDLNQIINLSELDKEHKKIEFKTNKGKIVLRSKSFELSLGICNGEKVNLPILKEQLEKVDSENYQIVLGDSRMVLSSIDSNTTTALGALDVNDYDTDKDVEL